MARGKRFRTAGVAKDNARQGQKGPKPCQNSRSMLILDQYWSMFPSQAKNFILDCHWALEGGDLHFLSTLVDFWSQPQNVHCLQGFLAQTLRVSAGYLALEYLRMDKIKEACLLTVNGSFIHQCHNSSIGHFKSALGEPDEVFFRMLPYFGRGLSAATSIDEMERYNRRYLTVEKTPPIMTDLSNPSSMMGFINQISDDWNRSPSKSHQPVSSNNGGETIKITLEDESNKEETRSFDINSSTTLKALFNDYADERSISLRSLRFSYAGKTLFLSNAGQNTPKQMGMKDQDVIKVHDSSTAQESNDGVRSGQAGASKLHVSKKNKSKKRTNIKTKGKGKRRQQYKEPTRTLQECRVQHSTNLTKIHDEAEDQFKSIRQRLNNLSIERSTPKPRCRPAPKRVPPPFPSETAIHFDQGLGGKAGKSRFVVQVGEVQNLYKTAKRSIAPTLSSAPVPTLDLHGCTREEALSRLDESLDIWVNEAMHGSYPFVRQAMIVCGCGSQTLSDAVEGWIRSNARVSNAPRPRPAVRS